MLRLQIYQLAKLARVAPGDVSRFEYDVCVPPETIASIRNALESADIEFVGEGLGVRLKASE